MAKFCSCYDDFGICIALEGKAIQGENEIFKWDE